MLAGLASTVMAGKVNLVRGAGRNVPGGPEQVERFIRSYTRLESEVPALERFKFSPTDADKERMARLRSGGYDTSNILCLRVEFLEDTTPLTTGNGKMDTFGFFPPDSGLFIDPPHFKRYFERQMEGVRNYYLAQSMGRLCLNADVFPREEKRSYQLPREMMFYGDTSWNAVELGLVRLLRDAIKEADKDTAIDFSKYEEVIEFHAGSGLQSDYGLRNDSPYDLLAGEIPAGALEAYLGEPFIRVDDTVRVDQATVLPEMMRQDTMYGDDINILGMVGLAGTLVHEVAHLLGAYDLYDVSGYTMGVGGWSLMGYGGWLGDYSAGAPPGVIPGFMDAYTRRHLGLVDSLGRIVNVRTPRESIPVYAAAMDTTLFGSRGDSTTPTIVRVPINADEYFLIENRQIDVHKPDTIIVDTEDDVLIGIEDNEYDFFQPGSGLLIWHVDESVIADYGPFNAVNYQRDHKGVDMEEGDGVQDFDVFYWESWDPYAEIYGAKYDPFFKGGYNDRFTTETNPNSDGYTGRSFLSVTLLGDADSTDRLKDTIIKVSIDWDLYQPKFPKAVSVNPLLMPAVADVNLDGRLELVVCDTGGLVSMMRDNGDNIRTFGMGSGCHAAPAVGNVMAGETLEVVVAGTDGLVRVVPWNQAPVTLATGDRILAAPVLADLDGDGRKDIIVGSTDMKLYAWAWHDSFSLLPGFPIDVGAEIRAPVAVTDTVSPDIVLLTGDGRLFLYSAAGVLRDSFPLVLSHIPFYNTCQPMVADVDRDGEKEIVVVAASRLHNRMFVLGLDGKLEYQSPEVIKQPFAGAAGLADVNADGYPDVLCASKNDLFAFSRNAALVSNYPFKQDSTYETSEIAGNWLIYYDVYFEYLSSPVVADFDSNGVVDVAIGSPRYGVLGHETGKGRPPRLFPLMTTASVSSPLLATDLDRDGDVELIAAADNGIVYAWDLPGPAASIAWPGAYHDACHTGLVPDSELPVMPDPDTALVDRFYVYPNPAAAQVTCRYWLGQGESEVTLRLLDMAGEPAGNELEGSALALADNETVLDLSGTDPGLYVVKLTVRGSGRTEVRFAKLAIVR